MKLIEPITTDDVQVALASESNDVAMAFVVEYGTVNAVSTQGNTIEPSSLPYISVAQKISPSKIYVDEPLIATPTHAVASAEFTGVEQYEYSTTVDNGFVTITDYELRVSSGDDQDVIYDDLYIGDFYTEEELELIRQTPPAYIYYLQNK